jgi:hypothetical protein
MYTIGPGIWQETLKNEENEIAYGTTWNMDKKNLMSVEN